MSGGNCEYNKEHPFSLSTRLQVRIAIANCSPHLKERLEGQEYFFLEMKIIFWPRLEPLLTSARVRQIGIPVLEMTDGVY